MHQGMDGQGRIAAVRRAWATVVAAAGLSFAGVALPESGPADAHIRLEISPRICTLSGNDKQCATPVRAQWHSSQDESLCLVILARQEAHHCWEHYKAGTYTIDLVFTDDVLFQLRDVSLNHVLASAALRVIREAIQYRHRRRQPWNIFN
jgi:hypothetical protein